MLWMNGNGFLAQEVQLGAAPPPFCPAEPALSHLLSRPTLNPTQADPSSHQAPLLGLFCATPVLATKQLLVLNRARGLQ